MIEGGSCAILGIVILGFLGGDRGASKSSRGRGCGKSLLITASPKPLKTGSASPPTTDVVRS